ncbi:Ctr copper transporter [Penicillium cf. griseofulvum]|uniref:Copper transport protein n=1 Tax=Penicillium cf. griseofulvum TaxID=2972120 RepID=A0A9W9M9K6_9EURO|nr:Ctr copper transporter [Penicillium cf. griseofulvum]KAJ5445605.1 Ctr copper transporter [Penicillium cf. griseofulvum]KAJ5447326.1 Ctr copper transporter [Penicillium cf. griseofulvum]
MEGMDMSSSTHSMSSSSPMSMSMVFQNTHDTPLFSNTWTPSSSGSFAGTCIFLIILAIIDRCLIAFKATMERHWLATHLNRRYVTVAGKNTEAGNIASDPDAKFASLITAQGVEKSVKVVHNITHGPIPWRFSVDLPRALLFLCIVGISYLLMLAVMTMNIGYFCSVLGGAFLGELAVGRFIQTNEHGH